MRHEMLTQHALFCHRANTKRGMLSQHFVTHVVPPLGIIHNYKEGVAFSDFTFLLQTLCNPLYS